MTLDSPPYDSNMRRTVAPLLGLACALITTGAAAAGGATSVAKAPLVRPGVLVTADTSTDATATGSVGSDDSRGCWIDHEFWRVTLAARDSVVIRGTGYHVQIGVFPPGTTDRNVNRSSTIATGFPGEGVTRFTARSAGTYVLVAGPNCYNGPQGPFSFTLAVTHAH
jgi:hypothetical protein